jgi:hypothetical protein
MGRPEEMVRILEIFDSIVGIEADYPGRRSMADRLLPSVLLQFLLYIRYILRS